MRLIRKLLVWLLVLAALAALAAWFALRGSVARVDGVVAGGVKAKVTVERDALGTATISGENRADLVYALGYLHGQERYFQMDLLRRVAAGELAELFGTVALDVDKRHRLHRFRARAATALAALPAQQREIVERYRDGVNAGLADLTVRPWEYLLLRAPPAPWRNEDSALAIYAMFLDLNGDGENARELNLARLKAQVPEPLYRFLVQPGSPWDAPIRGEPLPPVAIPGPQVFDLRTAMLELPPDLPRFATLSREDLGEKPGSNNFAVGGALTVNGAALVADDMHLGLRVPNIWYRARLRYPDPNDPARTVDLNGVTLPGAPALLAGSNGRIAWGYTNSYGDWTDWVRVVRDPADPARYRTGDGDAAIEKHAETIRVKGAADVALTVEETRWGPIMAADVDGTPLALAWTAHDPRVFNLDLMQLEQVNTARGALALAPSMGMPVQNFVVGDADGMIGWTLTGNALPRRAGYDPTLPADWSRAGIGWTGWVDAAEFPRVFNPPDARLWSANARVIDGDALALVGDGGYDLGARARQIRDGLRSHERFTAAEMLSVQLDDRALFLAPWRELLRKTVAGTTDAAFETLRHADAAWDGYAAVDDAQYSLVREFRVRTIAAALAPFEALGKKSDAKFELPSAQTYEAPVWALVTERPAHLLDPRYADWNDLLLAAARDAATRVAGETWGARNVASIRHPLSRALPGFLARHLDMPAQPLPGDKNMPRVQGPAFGASERFAISPGHENESYLMMPGGQSGHPLSPFHGAGHEDWVRGRPTPLLPGKTVYRLELKPASP